MQSYEILMGACGWEHPQWQDEFYPEDLPPEWRLAYYGNEFPVVLIPQGYWAVDIQTIGEWVEETDERPLFIAEMPPPAVLASQGSTPAQWVHKLNPLKSRLLGVCCHATREDELGEALALIPWDIPVCVQGMAVPSDSAADDAGGSRSVGCCWDGTGNADCLQQGPLAIARIDSQNIEPRELRRIVETCRQAAGENRVVALLADGDPPQLETLRNAEVIAQLI